MKKVIILFGPPGAGKGTQSEKLAATYNLLHISTGDLMRKEKNSGSELGDRIKAIPVGQLAPDDLALEVLQKEMLNNKNVVEGFILDGFPRTVQQVPMLEELLSSINCQLTDVFGLEISDKNELVARLVERGKSSNREDDQNPTIIEERLQIYENTTKPIIDSYKSKSIYRSINGLDSIEAVFSAIGRYLVA